MNHSYVTVTAYYADLVYRNDIQQMELEAEREVTSQGVQTEAIGMGYSPQTPIMQHLKHFSFRAVRQNCGKNRGSGKDSERGRCRKSRGARRSA